MCSCHSNFRLVEKLEHSRNNQYGWTKINQSHKSATDPGQMDENPASSHECSDCSHLELNGISYPKSRDFIRGSELVKTKSGDVQLEIKLYHGPARQAATRSSDSHRPVSHSANKNCVKQTIGKPIMWDETDGSGGPSFSDTWVLRMAKKSGQDGKRTCM